MTDHPSASQTTAPAPDMTRRTALALAATAGAAAAAWTTAASAADEMDHSAHMNHGAKHQALIDAALSCVGRGEACSDHCIALMSTGDTSIKDCLRSVSAMLPMCTALVRLAAFDAKRLKEFAKVCSDVCADCEAECKKHADKHALCKACMDSCTACIKECNKLIDA